MAATFSGSPFVAGEPRKVVTLLLVLPSYGADEISGGGPGRMLKNFLQAFRPGGTFKSPTPFNAGMEEFLPLNVEWLARRLDVDKKAKQRGGSNLPPTDQDFPDDLELAIESEVSNIARGAHSSLTDHLKTFRERALSILASDPSDRIRSIAQGATTSMFAQVRTGTGILFSEKRDFVQANLDLTGFTEQHGITRPASYPESRFLLFSILALLLVGESAANAALIGDASEFGILGGFAEMIGISFINLTTGFATGRLLVPQLSRRSFVPRAFFGLLVIAAVSAILVFNLFVGHYRDVIAISATDLGIVDFGARAVQRLSTTPFGLQDFKSWVFMFLGIIFSGFALADGIKWDDIYPGYGSRDRMRKNLVNKYGRDFERLQNELEKLSVAGIANINMVSEGADYHQQELKAITERIAGLREKLEAYYAQLERDGQQLTQRYRQGNIAARASKPPNYFNTKFEIPAEEKRVPNLVLTDSLDAESLRSAARSARKSVEEMHRRLLDVYETIDQLTEAETQDTRPDTFVERVTEIKEQVAEYRAEQPPTEPEA